MADQNTPDNSPTAQSGQDESRLEFSDSEPAGELGYESGVDRAKRDPHVHRVRRRISFGLGFFVGFCFAAYLSAVVAVAASGYRYDTTSATRHRLAAADLLVAIGLGVLVRYTRLWRSGRTFLLGALIGGGILLLLGGICFSLR